MNDPENFLERWSRRKREETAEPDRARDEKDEKKDPQGAPQTAPAEQSASAAPSSAAAQAPAEPVFDLSTLPAIESITAETDIRAFLAPGVPAELRLAALRRAWIADPKVRDFVGLNDYDFDFHTPGAIPGFGSLEMTDDLRQEVARIVTAWRQEPEPAGALEQPGTAPKPAPAVSSVQPVVPATEMNARSRSATPDTVDERNANRDQATKPQDELIAQEAITQRNKGPAAMQQQHSPPENLQTLARRGHGSALPK